MGQEITRQPSDAEENRICVIWIVSEGIYQQFIGQEGKHHEVKLWEGPQEC